MLPASIPADDPGMVRAGDPTMDELRAREQFDRCLSYKIGNLVTNRRDIQRLYNHYELIYLDNDVSR